MGINEELVKKIKNGNRECEEELIKNNEALIYKIISEFYYLCENPQVKEELVQAGNLGLIKALKGFDPKYGTKFTTYAYKFIKGEILRIVEGELNRDITFSDCFYHENEEIDLCHEEIADYINSTMGDCCCKSSEEIACNKIFSSNILKHISYRQKEILQLRYFEDKTQQEIGKLLGIHQVEVSREEKRAKKILLSFMKEGISC